MYRIHELGQVNTDQETKVYEVTGSDDKRIENDKTVRSAVSSAEMLDDVITIGCVIVEPIR